MNRQTVLLTNQQATETRFTALVIDDQTFNRRLYQLLLDATGYEITEAGNGLHGLNILMRQTFDLLLLDLAMPYVDGMTLLTAIRRKPLHDNMRVVVVTANASLTSGKLHELADYVLHKPIDVIAFQKFIERLKDDPNATYCPRY